MRRVRPSAARLRAAESAKATGAEDVKAVLAGQDRARLRIRDPKTGVVGEFGVAWVRDVPNLADALATAIVLHARKPGVQSMRTVETYAASLRNGLVAFLLETGRSDLALHQLDGGVFQALIRWLSLTENGKAKRVGQTRLKYFNAAVEMLSILRSDPNHRGSVVPAGELPVAPWPKRAPVSVRPQQTIGEGDLRAIFVAAAAAVRRLSRDVGSDMDLVDGAAPADPAQAERREVLIRVRQHVRDGNGAFTAIQRAEHALSTRIEALGRDGIMRSARPKLPDLVPFMALMTIAFRLNGLVLLSAKRSDFDVRAWVGGPRVFASPYKPRAGRRMAASTSVTAEAINPARILELLDRWLEPLRSLTGSGTLFQYWSGAPIDLGGRAKPDDFAIRVELRRLAAAAGVEADVTLNRLRAAVLDLAHIVSRGDLLKVKAAAGHASIQTTGDHYVTAAGMAREDEALAKAMTGRAVMIGTRGLFDPRRMPDEPTDACTPGWQCERRTDAPFEVDRVDGLCIAYGRCPVCRHGTIDHQSPRACAQTHLLVEAIERAIENMPPAAWRAQLAPIRMHLIETVLPNFGPEIHRKAAMLELPLLPSPE